MEQKTNSSEQLEPKSCHRFGVCKEAPPSTAVYLRIMEAKVIKALSGTENANTSLGRRRTRSVICGPLPSRELGGRMGADSDHRIIAPAGVLV